MFFHIQFRGQLRRTRPELIESLENAVAVSASQAGGIVETGHKVFCASFDEDRICFWLDIVVFLKEVNRVLEKATSELYGFALVLGRNADGISAQKLCRFHSGRGDREISGIWCSEEILNSLKFYIVFGRPSKSRKKGALEGYRELKEFRSFEADRRKNPNREKIVQSLAMEAGKNTLLLNPGLPGINDGIYYYCAGLLRDIPPIIVRFGAGGRGLVCFADAWTEELRAFFIFALSGKINDGGRLDNLEKMIGELDVIRDLLFRERLRDECSPNMMEQGRVFIQCFLSMYISAARAGNQNGVLILEDITLAETSVDVFIDVYSSITAGVTTTGANGVTGEEKGKLLVLGTGSSQKKGMKRWESVFDRVLKFTPEETGSQESFPPDNITLDFLERIPKDLLELSYCISLFGRYFPVQVIPLLLEEGGLNRNAYSQALHILSALGLSTPEDPRPFIRDFESLVENVLGERIEKVRSMVRSRFLSWALSGRLYPCFNLLKLLSGLGERIDDALVLKSVRADVFNGTYRGIEKAISQGYFASSVGNQNAPLVEFIYKTLKALVWGEALEIRQVFKETPPMEGSGGKPSTGLCQAHVEANLAAFYVGIRDTGSASEAVRKALLLNRELGEDAVPAYRFFSLVNLSRQRIEDALEYVSFALEQAEGSKQQEELFLANYYASSINFLYGNLSKAERLALRAEETAFELGQVKWGMRARFLRARLSFEIGRYGDALEIFESILSGDTAESPAVGSAENVAEMADTVRAWIFRTKNFLGRFSLLNGDLQAGSIDLRLFEIEAAYFSSDYKRAGLLADQFLSSPPADEEALFFFTEQPDWGSGFSQCEYIYQPEKVPGTRLVQVYQAMAQSAQHPSPEVKVEILSWMQRFMRDELLPDTDPNDAIYFFAWCCILKDSKSPNDEKTPPGLRKFEMQTSQVDLKTVISMALKRLHRRASRIDDMETRQAFLNLPRWNNALQLVARENKLV